MHFDFDDRRFTVCIAARPLILDGEPCRAKLDRARQRIWISDQLPRHQRRRELFHELRHCWIDARGRTQDDEADAIDAAAMMDQVLEQYLQQGGDAVLEALEPEPQAAPSRAPMASLAQVVIHCGDCGAAMAVGSVANSPPRWDEDLAVWTIDRGVLCEVCDHVTLWREQCTAEGMPTGNVVPHPQPRVIRGSEAAAWIAEHHERCRVVMV